MHRFLTLSLLPAVSPAFAQSVATYAIVHSGDGANADGVMSFEVYGWAEQEAIGDRSGIHGVNLSLTLSGAIVEAGSIRSNHEVFGGTNIRLDDEGFDISFASNGFTGHNFSSGLALVTFDVRIVGANEIVLGTEQGELSLFGAAIGVPAPFAAPVAYDIVNHAVTTVSVPMPGTVAGVAGVSLFAWRRPRRVLRLPQ
ncbi:MAG: hypothetical protein AAF297_03025 [Planctomycetota bacterium]